MSPAALFVAFLLFGLLAVDILTRPKGQRRRRS